MRAFRGPPASCPRSSCCSRRRLRTPDRPRPGPRSTCRRVTTLEPIQAHREVVSCGPRPVHGQQIELRPLSRSETKSSISRPERRPANRRGGDQCVICRRPEPSACIIQISLQLLPVSSSYLETVKATFSRLRSPPVNRRSRAVIIGNLERAFAFPSEPGMRGKEQNGRGDD